MASGELTIYRGCTPVVDAQYGDDSTLTATEAIIDALATAADTDPMDLPPLYEFVDPDAIDNLFHHHDGSADAEALLSFKVDVWNVFVRADGRIRVCDGTRPTDPTPVFDSSSTSPAASAADD